jgi:uncharacterized protein YggE
MRRPLLALVAFSLLTAPILLVSASSPASAAEAVRSITVTGQGVVVASPDAAEIGAGVVSTGATAAAALADNTKRMTEVFEGLKALGVGERELRTSNFSVSPVYARQPRDSEAPPTISGYHVSNMVHVRLRDTADVGRVLDRLVALGANSINSVEFVISDRYERLQGALAEAVKNARTRAVLMAEAAGAQLGPVLTISESAAPLQRPVFAMKAMAESADVPVSGSEETLQVTVQATFALE